jgi:hypothetical protein
LSTHLTAVDAGVADQLEVSNTLKPVPRMSHNPGVMHANFKTDEASSDEARQEIIEACNRMLAQCKEWLVANDVPPEDGPAPALSGIDFVDYTRRVNVPTNVPANIPILESLNEVYVAEGALLNRTQRALIEHHLRFDKDPEDPGYCSVPEQIRMMQAMAASVRAFVLTGSRVPTGMLTCVAEKLMS